MSLFAVKSPLPFAKAWNSGSAASPAHSRSTNTATSFMPPVSNPWTSSPLAFTKSMKPANFSLPPASMSKKWPRSSTANSSAPSFAPPNPRAAATSSALPAAPEIRMQSPYNVLFLCTGNSARSIMAEAILNQKGQPNFAAYSAGSFPTGRVNPFALKQLEAARLPTSHLRSKSWDEFAKPGAPKLDFVFTVCDNAAREVCPIWPGHPMTAHWGVPDPAAVQGPAHEVERAYREAFSILERRIGMFLSLPLASIDKLALKNEIAKIGQQ